jgi:uncharacterized glyoxalase superfamily protein PhnB
MTTTSTVPVTSAVATPYLCVHDAAAAIDFYVAAFGAVEAMRIPQPPPDTRLGHAEISVGGARIMLSDEFPEMGVVSPRTLGGSPFQLHLSFADVDIEAVFAQAVAAGATVTRPLADQFYGERAGSILDPFGHRWTLAASIEDLTDDEIVRRAASAPADEASPDPATEAAPAEPSSERAPGAADVRVPAVSAIVLRGVPVLRAVKADLRTRIEALVADGVTPGLGTVLVGDDPASAKYVGMKHKDCAELGIASRDVRLPADAGQAQVEAVVDELNADPDVDGYLLQHPFPRHLDFEAALPPGRPRQGRRRPPPGQPRAASSRGSRAPALHAGGHPGAARPPRRAGRRSPRRDRRAGLTVGKPLANLLALKEPAANAAVTLLHTGVADLTPTWPPPTSSSPPPGRRASSPGRWSSRGRRWSRRAPPSSTAPTSPTWTTTSPRSPAGSLR